MTRFFFTTLFLILTAYIVVVVHSDTIEIAVGGTNGELTFSPAQVNANPGDKLEFKLAGGDHTVVQSGAADCNALAGGFKSDDNFAKSGFTYEIPSGKNNYKIWYFCSVAQHCAGGMKGVALIGSGGGGSSNSSASGSGSGSTPTQTSPPTGTGSSSGATPTGTNSAAALDSRASYVFGLLAVLGVALINF